MKVQWPCASTTPSPSKWSPSLLSTDNVVRMYTCGPTVYNFVHIGNLRTFTFQDILRRWLRARGYRARPRDEHHRRGGQNHPQRRRRA